MAVAPGTIVRTPATRSAANEGGGARRTTEDYLRGRVTIEGLDEDRGSRLEIAFQNEWVVAWRDEAPLAMSPDLICVLDTVSGEAFGTETISYGRRASVIALPARSVFLTRKGLEHVSPRLRLRSRFQVGL
jgi:DUF917 family protein